VQGVIDCCFEEDGRMILIDYKSNFIRQGKQHEAELERIKEEYRVQTELYSEAIMKGTGKEVSEAYLYLFTSGETVDMMQKRE
jgi:ATP-dependent helicase/nuclease subunit A